MTTRWAQSAHKWAATILSLFNAPRVPALDVDSLLATAEPASAFSSAVAAAHRKNFLADPTDATDPTDPTDNRRPDKPAVIPLSTQPAGGCPCHHPPVGQCRNASRGQLGNAAYFAHPRFDAFGRNADASPIAPSGSCCRGDATVAGVFTRWVPGTIPSHRRSVTKGEADFPRLRACSATTDDSLPEQRANCAPARASFTN